jgi:protein O-mannosyl-transferase
MPESQLTSTTMTEDRDSQSRLLAIVEGYLRRPLPMVSFLACVTFLLYRATLSFGFVWDDEPQIIENPLIRNWDSVGRVFFSDLWFHTQRGQLYYRPLFVVWSTLNYALFGLKPWGWHLASVVLYIACTATVFFLARRLRMPYWTAALGAALFAFHPVHVECVAWVSAASDTMVTIFYVLALCSLLKSRDAAQTKARLWYLLSLVLLGCALLTKEMAITFPAVVALYFWIFSDVSAKGQRLWAAVRVAIPYGVMTGGYLLLRKLALHSVVATFDPEHTIVHVLLTLPLVLVKYLRILVAPFGLTGAYYDPYVESPGSSRFLLPVVVLAVLVFLVRLWHKRTGDKSVVFLALFTPIALSPVLYLRNFGNGDFVRDRYMFLPSIGFILLAAKAVQLLPRLRGTTAQEVRLAATLGICAVLCWGALTQQMFWKSNLLLFKRGHDLYPDSTYAIVGLTSALSERGAHKEAAVLAEEATRRHPRSFEAWSLLAQEYAATGRIEEGRVALATALTINDVSRSDIGAADLAGIYGRLGEYDKALALCSQVLEREPNVYAALYNCGNINFLTKNYSEAENLLTRAIQQGEEFYQPHYFLGRVYLATGRPAEAERQLRYVLSVNGQDYQAHYWLGVILEGDGKLREAQSEYQKSVDFNPDFSDGKVRLTALQDKLGTTAP